MAHRTGEREAEDDWRQQRRGEAEEEKCNSRFRLFPIITLAAFCQALTVT